LKILQNASILGFVILNNVNNGRLGLTETAGFHDVSDLPSK
jgi:hypothetical protein